MKKIINACIILFVFFIPLSIFAQTDEEVQALVDNCIANKKTRGMAVAIIDEKGIRYFCSGYLNNDLIEKVKENTLFEIGSITKVITTSLLQILVDRNEFSLDDTLQMHMPSDVRVPKYNDKEITLLHLATNYSGFPYVPENSHVTELGNPFAGYTVELLYEYLNTKELEYEPGTKYDYSNLGMGLLGYIMSLKYQMTYEEIVKKELFEPLGMENTCISLTPIQKLSFAKGHVGEDEVQNWDLPVIESSGALRSTIKDLAVFASANLGLMPCPFYNSFKKTHKPRKLANHSYEHIGLGWHISKFYGNTLISHNGSTGGYHSFIGLCPEKKRGVVLLSNSSTNIDDVASHLIDERHQIREDEQNIVIDPVVLDRYVGKYRHFTGLSCQIERKGKKLIGSVIGHPPVELFPTSPSNFYTTVLDAQVEFSTDERGNVLGLTAIRGDQRFWIRKLN